MFEGLEERVSKAGNISYWKDGGIVYKQCTRCREIKPVTEFGKQKRSDGYRERCKTCRKLEGKEYNERNAEKVKERNRKYYQSHKEKVKEYKKKYKEENKDKISARRKQYYRENIDKIKEYRDGRKDIMREYNKEYRKNNIERLRECEKEYRIKNRERKAEYDRRYRTDNSDRIKERCLNVKKENIQAIENMLEKINPIFEKTNLPVYGYIYKITNIKTNHTYIGQSTQPLKGRYRVDIIRGWIEERKERTNQKFLEELNEEDLELTEVLDVAFCQYHLDKIEAHYIDKYDSCNNGYNNNAGNYKTNDGIEEFENILNQYGLEYINGELRRIA